MTDASDEANTQLPVPGEIWRTTTPGNQENAREVVAVGSEGTVSFFLRAPPGRSIEPQIGVQNVGKQEWVQWTEKHKAEPIALDDMQTPPGWEPLR